MPRRRAGLPTLRKIHRAACDICGNPRPDSIRIFDEHEVSGTFCLDCWQRLLRSPSHRNDQALDQYYRRTYGLGLVDYSALLLRQKGRCAICNQESEKPLVVDHDHETENVRGLLCSGCNTGLGCFRDDPAALGAAITYLLRPDPVLTGWDLTKVNTAQQTKVTKYYEEREARRQKR